MSSPSQREAINLQPHPRLLTVLGDIEFAPWQCIAELIDNAFDEFLRHPAPAASEITTELTNDPAMVERVPLQAPDLTWTEIVIESAERLDPPTVWVTLPGKNSTPRDGEVWVKDNGPGMTLEVLNNALRAGWTSNDRYGQLGLFGVGFNIATARLGHVAMVRTAREGDGHWTVVTIDLHAMAAGETFNAPVSTEPKSAENEHGTEIVIRQLRPEHHDTLSRGQSRIKLILGDVYSHLLTDRGFQLIVDGEAVKPRRPCVWDESRSVVRSNERIPAVIKIDYPLPDRHACLDCGMWQDAPETNCAGCDSDRVEVRPRRIWGWVGIQRYLHKNDYGIDFIRNGRKILLRDDSLFRWDDPDDPSGRGELEYPIEVPRAGRIVGEIHIDHVRVNYQKNAFEYATTDWKKVVRVLRGEGPLQPKKAKALGYSEANTSPLARLYAGYRRNNPGLDYLIPGDGKHALHELAKEWANRFRKGDPEFQTDEKWYLAAKQHDEPPTAPADPISDPTDILSAKGLTAPPPGATTPFAVPEPAKVETEEERRERWREHGHRLPDLEAKFGLPGHGAAIDVTAWLVHGQRLTRPEDSDRVPVYVGAGKGPKVEVFVDGDHPVFTDFAVDTRDLVVIELAEYMRVRDRTPRALSAMFYDLKEKCLPDHKIGGAWLGETANTLLNRVRETMQPVIAGAASGYWALLSAEDHAQAELRFALEGAGSNWTEVLDDGDWIDFVPPSALVHLLRARPDAFLDKRVFRSAHGTLNDPGARAASAERVVDLLADVAVLVGRPARRSPEELQRGRLSCLLLETELVPQDNGAT